MEAPEEDGRKKPFLEGDRRRLVRREEDPAGLADLLRDVRTVSGHRDFLPPDDLPKARVGDPIAAQELVELDGNRLILFPGEAEVFPNLFVERLPGLEFHPKPRRP